MKLLGFQGNGDPTLTDKILISIFLIILIIRDMFPATIEKRKIAHIGFSLMQYISFLHTVVFIFVFNKVIIFIFKIRRQLSVILFWFKFIMHYISIFISNFILSFF